MNMAIPNLHVSMLVLLLKAFLWHFGDSTNQLHHPCHVILFQYLQDTFVYSECQLTTSAHYEQIRAPNSHRYERSELRTDNTNLETDT